MVSKAVGGGLRALATLLYMLDFLCAAGILGIYSYFLAKLNIHGLAIINQWRAVEGLAGAAVLYTIFAILLTCFLAGRSIFAFLGMILDLLFCGAMIAIAVLVREAAQSCSGTVVTPVGTGLVSGTSTSSLNYGTACKLNLTVLVLACAGALFFLLSFLMQLIIAAHHRKEKGFGPSPANDYTSGSAPKKGGLFRRRTKTTKEAYLPPTNGETELGTVVPAAVVTDGALATDRQNIRPSHDTGYTGTTYNPADNMANNKYESYAAVPAPQPTPTYTTGPQIVSSTTETRPAYYDPTARLETTDANGFASTQSAYTPNSGKRIDNAF